MFEGVAGCSPCEANAKTAAAHVRHLTYFAAVHKTPWLSLWGGGNRSFTFLTPAPTSSVTFCQTCHDRKSLGPSHRVYHETLPLWWCVTASWKSSAVVSWAQLKLSPHWSCIWSSVLTKLPVACTGNMTHTYRRFHTFCLLSKSYISFFVILFDDTTTTT